MICPTRSNNRSKAVSSKSRPKKTRNKSSSTPTALLRKHPTFRKTTASNRCSGLINSFHALAPAGSDIETELFGPADLLFLWQWNVARVLPDEVSDLFSPIGQI